MRVTFRSFAVISLLLMLCLSVRAQERNKASVTVDELQVQLIEVQEKEGSLRIREQQLEEDLKPANIERALAGIGSTKPEELREARRRQLTIEHESVKAQLKVLEITKTRLETAIATAQGRAYQESALPGSSPPVNTLRADVFAYGPALMLGLVLSLLVSLGTVIFYVKGLSR
jgi:hypothetical protein